MRAVFVFALFGLLQCLWSLPVDDPSCEMTFSKMLCDEWNEMDDTVARERRQIGGGIEGDVLESLLRAKLNFLTQFGLLKHIPLLGQFIHDIVQRDPDGVANALKGGIFGVLNLVGPLVLGALG